MSKKVLKIYNMKNVINRQKIEIMAQKCFVNNI